MLQTLNVLQTLKILKLPDCRNGPKFKKLKILKDSMKRTKRGRGYTDKGKSRTKMPWTQIWCKPTKH